MGSAAALVAFLLIAGTLLRALLLPLAHRSGREMKPLASKPGHQRPPFGRLQPLTRPGIDKCEEKDWDKVREKCGWVQFQDHVAKPYPYTASSW
jgi:hypothetical protein